MISIDKFFVASDYREQQEGVGELALSIEKKGLIHPIAVKPSGDRYEVIAGRRRFYALRDYLKLDALEEGEHYVVREGMDALVCQLIENVDRLDFKPVEAAKLIKAIHDRGVAEKGRAVKGKGGGWSIADTAKTIGRTKGFVTKMLKIAENESLVEGATSIDEAYTKVVQESKKELLSAVQKARVSKAKRLDISDIFNGYHNTDAITFLTGLAPASVDLILTDPPYGIDLDTIVDGCYPDQRESLIETLKACMPHFRRILKPDRFIIVWTAFDLFSTVLDLMRSEGFSPAPTPLLWVKPNSSGRSVQANQRLGCIAECAVYGTSGPGAELTTKGLPNVFNIPMIRGDKIHPAQKPETLIETLINTFSRKGDTVLDVFAGSASTLRACISTDRRFLGCEKSEEFYNASVAHTLDWISKFHGETFSEEDDD